MVEEVMARVVNVPPGQSNVAATGLFNVLGQLLARKITGDRAAAQREKEDRATREAAGIEQAVRSGGLVPPQKLGRPTITRAGELSPEFQESLITGKPFGVEPRPQELADVLLRAGLDPDTAVERSTQAFEARGKVKAEEKEREELERSLDELSQSVPPGEGRELLRSLIASKVATRAPNFAITLLQNATLFGGAKSVERIESEAEAQARGTRKGGRKSLQQIEDEARAKAKGTAAGRQAVTGTAEAKPSEADKDVEAILTERGLPKNVENRARARLLRTRAPQALALIDKRLRRDQDTGLFPEPMFNVVSQVAEGEIGNLFFTEGDKSTGAIASAALDRANALIQSGQFLPEGMRPGEPNFSVKTTAKFLQSRFGLERVDIEEIISSLAKSLNMPLADEDLRRTLDNMGIK